MAPHRSALVALVLLVVTMAGCSNGTPKSTPKLTEGALFGDISTVATTEDITPPTAPDGTINLREAKCPDRIVILTDGPPALNQSAYYALAGGVVPSERDRYVDDLLDPSTGKSTGVQIELRFSEPGTNLGALTTDPSIFGALATTDDQLFGYAKFPTIAVVSPWQRLDRILYWDPGTYPQTQAIPDLGLQNIGVRVADQGPWLGHLIRTGLLTQPQIVPAGPNVDLATAFVADRGRLASEGSALIEPVTLGKSSRWGRPLGFQLVADAGYDPYPAALVVRPGAPTQQRSCLRAFVPLVQAAQALFVANPAPVARLINQMQRRVGVVGPSPAVLVARSRRAVELGLIANSPDGVLGSIDQAKIRQLLAVLTPVARRRRTPLAPSIKAENLFTREFVNRLAALPQ